MKNLFITNLHLKDVNHFTSDIGLFLRRKMDRPFKKLCNIFTNANIIRLENATSSNDEEYYNTLQLEQVLKCDYVLSQKNNANNIVLERYPNLDKNESYIFVGNHTCPEDIETMLNIIDRNAYLILGSVETLKYNPEMYLSWLNGMVVFDILDKESRCNLIPKMERVLKTNSILIFPEGSHNYHPNKIINNVFDGAVRLALKTGKKIVPISMVRYGENKVSYIDVGNPIEVSKVNINVEDYYKNEGDNEKYRIKAISSYVRDKMATGVYHLIARHSEVISRRRYIDIEKYFIEKYVDDSFKKLKWKNDVFDAEYLTKQTEAEREYEAIVSDICKLIVDKKDKIKDYIDIREFILKQIAIERHDVISNMKSYFYKK